MLITSDNITNIALGDFRTLDGTQIEFANFMDGKNIAQNELILTTSLMDLKTVMTSKYGTVRIPLANDRAEIITSVVDHVSSELNLPPVKLINTDSRGESFMRAKIPRVNGEYVQPGLYKRSTGNNWERMYDKTLQSLVAGKNFDMPVLIVVRLTGVWREICTDPKEFDLMTNGISARVESVLFPHDDTDGVYESITKRYPSSFKADEDRIVIQIDAPGKSQPMAIPRSKAKASRSSPM